MVWCAYLPAPADLFKGWSQKPWFETASKIAQSLQWKGMCVIESDLEAAVLKEAVNELEKMKGEGKLKKPCKEVLCGLFGATGSAWTCELPLLDEDAKCVPAGERALREVEMSLEDLGTDLETCTLTHFDMQLEGRTNAVVHRMRNSLDDEPHPPLEDPKEADAYANLFCRKKVKMLIHLGPDDCIITVLPHDKKGVDKDTNSWRATLVPGQIFILRHDIAAVSEISFLKEAQHVSYTMEIDLFAERKGGLQQQREDIVPCPDELTDWFMRHVKKSAESVEPCSEDDVWTRVARQQLCKTQPVQILQVAHEMPFAALASSAAQSSSDRAPGLLQALTLGADCIAEVPASRWNVDAYFDEDADNVDNFKMYTRHIGCLDLNSLEEFDLQAFGMSKDDVQCLDKRQKLLTISAVACLTGAGWRRHGSDSKDLGVYCGLSKGDVYMDLLSGAAKLSQTAKVGPLGASRLAYLLACAGPSATVDTGNSSGSAALDSAIQAIRAGRCGPALVSSLNLLLHPFPVIFLCGAGLISRTGRSKVFDASSDGMACSEGCVSLLLRDHDRKRKADLDSEPQFEDFSTCRKLIAGSALSAQGDSSDVVATSAAAMQHVIRAALADGQVTGPLLDSTAVHACGCPLVDAVELGVMRRLTYNKDPKAGAGVLHAAKSLFGDAGAPASLMALASACALMEHGLHAPCIHLRQLMQPALLENGAAAGNGATMGRLHIPLEALEARTAVQTVGVSSFGSTGTNAHHVLWGKRLDGSAASAPRPVQNWPGAEYKETPVDMTHYIIGTWSAWEKMEQMRVEPDGTYVHTITLGENGWEAFQIYFQGKKSQMYYPAQRWGGSDCKVCIGADVDQSQAFVLDGRPKRVQLLNAAQLKVRRDRLDEAERAGVELPEWEFDGISYFSGNYKPEGYNDVGEDGAGMPVMEQDNELWGIPGDRYVIRFYVVAEYRRMQIIKVPLDYKHFEFRVNAGMQTLDMSTVRHTYYITGEHNFWGFEALTANPDDEGLFEGEVHLVEGSTRFQIVRDQDLDQTFYPRRNGAGQSVEMKGPDGSRSKNSWKIDGTPGDVIKVSFRRDTKRCKHEGDDDIGARAAKKHAEAVEAHKPTLDTKLATAMEVLDQGRQHGVLFEELYEEQKALAKKERETGLQVPAEKDFIQMTKPEQMAKMALQPKGAWTESLSLAWRHVGRRDVDFKALTASHRYYLAGSWNKSKAYDEMQSQQAGAVWSADIVVGASGRESFQILLNKNMRAPIHPACEDSSYLDPDHAARGPGGGDSGKRWLIGKHASERICAGDTVRITLVLSSAVGAPRPESVTWKTVEHTSA